MMRASKILVVEDNDGIRDFLHALFKDEGYEIAVVARGEPMRAALAQQHFDVTVIDITLPGADDGFALAELARASGCAVILVTGDARRFDAVANSGHRYLFKPFRVEHLLALVGELIADAEGGIVGARRAGR